MSKLIKPMRYVSNICFLLFMMFITFGQTLGKEESESIAPIKAPFEMPELKRPVFQDKDFNITDYNAIEGGENLNKTAFAEAINSCNAAGGGRVIVPVGRWLTVPIVLKSNVNLFLSEGAEVFITSDKEYFFHDEESRKKGDMSNPNFPISANHCENIAITGSGKIDANGLGWWPTHPKWWPDNKEFFDISVYEKAWEGLDKNIVQGRPQMFRPIYCKNVLLEGITFSNSPKWTINPVVCENVIIRNVTILARASKDCANTPNTDGINPESCKNVLVEHCTILTGDDSFAIKSGKDEEGRSRGIPSENIIIRHCDVRKIAIGSEMSGGVRNVFIHDIKLNGNIKNAIHIKTRRGRGGIVENIWIQDIEVNSQVESVIIVNMEYWTHVNPAPYEPVSERTPKFRNIFFKNITAVKGLSGTAIFVKGISEMPVENVSFKNIDVSAKEGIICHYANGASFRNIGLSNLENIPVEIKSCKNMSIDHLKFKEVGKPFILVKGSETEHIILDKAWKGQKGKILLEEGAKAEVIEFR